ncbi:MAG: galactose-1-phosphate uridylyltransferase, partial [Lachnospiraceae bacterium]|nr:galactose-1-phosphate uridylyltransferase [Lachnospiraceae bacterium]
MIQNNILELTQYALDAGLIQPADKVYTINRLLELFELDELGIPEKSMENDDLKPVKDLEEILEGMLDYAAEQG